MTVLIFFIVLGLLVFVHELGHFYVARRNGVYSEEFGFGFPPRIFGFRKVDGKYKFFFGNKDVESEDTIYSMNWIPLGGFVKIKGEAGDCDEPDSFSSKSVWQRFQIISAGVVMNFLFAMVLLSIGFWLGLPGVIDENTPIDQYENVKVQIVNVQQDSPAQEAGVQPGDEIISINDKMVGQLSNVSEYIVASESDTLSLKVSRLGKEEVLEVSRKIEEGKDKPTIGVGLVETGIISYPWYKSIWMGIITTLGLIWTIIVGFYEVIKGLIIGSGQSAELAGPVGIAVLTGQIADMGFVYLLQFTALLSINLGVLNFFPFPALDGGRAVFLLIEKVRGEPVSQKVENMVHTAGFVLLLGLILIITFNDIINLF